MTSEWQSQESAGGSVAKRPTMAIAFVVLVAVAGLAVWILPLLDLPFMQGALTIHPVVRVDGRSVKVSGTTDLPDGAVHFWHASDSGDIRGGRATVHDGAFEFEADLGDWPEGIVEVVTSSSVAWGTKQPQVVSTVLEPKESA